MEEELEKLFEGSYEFLEGKRVYCEEAFEVFKNPVTGSHKYNSQILARVSSGEFLTINTHYHVDKNYLPLRVTIDRTLGKQSIQEIFINKTKESKIYYTFITEDGATEALIDLPPKFHISTPSACTSFLYFLNKKFDQTGKNFYSILKSKNVWEFGSAPVFDRVFLESSQNQSTEITVSGKKLICHQFYLYEEEDTEKRSPLAYYVSRHMGLPYKVAGQSGNKIEIKHLKHLERDNSMYY